jgi:2-phosphoglycolate phosphatase
MKPHAARTGTRALLLDLDGTLIDTAPDMADALVRLQQRHDLAPLEFEKIRPWVSHGSTAMIRIGFGIDTDSEEFAGLRDAYLEEYEAQIADRSALFPGMPEVLDRCESTGIAWGVVTNKPGFLTDPLMESLNLTARAACIVSGDTVEKRKPHPMPLLHACMLLKIAPSECIYVGDAERDIQSGHKAGMCTALANWGYISGDDKPSNWGANILLDTPEDLLSYLQ